MNARSMFESALFVLLVAAGVVVRLGLQELPNFAPVAAIALFSGYLFRRRAIAAGVPLLVMGLSDLWIGGYDLPVMATVYAMLAAPALVGPMLRRRLQFQPGRWSAALGTTGALVTGSLAASAAFFVVTNFAVWLCYDYYPTSLAGLVDCYVQAVPFFRYTLAGDLFFSTLLFAAYAVAVAARPAPAAATDLARAA